MRIYTFFEWSQQAIISNAVCTFDYRHCLPNANESECIECYEDYVKTCIPEYCKEG